MKTVGLNLFTLLTLLILSLPLGAQTLPPIIGAPGAIWRASPNFNARNPKMKIDVLVLHSTCEPSAESAIKLFETPASKVSSHYVVDKDGAVTQMVSETERAWHAGVCRWEGRTDINSCSIGIEMQHQDQDPNDPWPDAQMQAVARLLADFRTRYRIPNDHVVFHSEVAYPPGRKTDPRNFDRPRLLRMVVQLAMQMPSDH